MVNISLALDIGTRSIVAILLEEIEKKVEIKKIIVKEHDNRSMVDGQIHNIPQVSELLREVQEEMNSFWGTPLKKVAVAAAGRSLKTVKTKVFQEVDYQSLSKEDVLKLELKGVQKAQKKILEKDENEEIKDYYCVGYSIINYFLDRSIIGDLVGQKGQEVGAELIATFLPRVVIDSLQAVLNDNGLELASITLEPIASINVILPSTMRKLNLALVDIGAGTSDIAISKDGSIVAYGMVAVAGDEITESICDKYLLDFSEGEKVKRELVKKEEIIFYDVLGLEQKVLAKELIKNISPAVQELAKKIAKVILDLNGTSPQAVILIGGGSRTPLLTDFLAEELSLPKERVGVQKAQAIKNILNLPQRYIGPEFITPIGIGMTALKHNNIGIIMVKVNNRKISILNIGDTKIIDALLAAGIQADSLYGKQGASLIFYINGIKKVIQGDIGREPIIKLNGQDAHLETLIKHDDKIYFESAKDGTAALTKIKEILPPSKSIMINGKLRRIPYEVIMDGKVVDINDLVQNDSRIYFREITQVGELLAYKELVGEIKINKINIIFNGQEQTFSFPAVIIEQNGKSLNLYDEFSLTDNLLIKEKDRIINVKEILSRYNIPKRKKEIQLTINDEINYIDMNEIQLKINGKVINEEYILKDGDTLVIDYFTRDNLILVDILPIIDFSVIPPAGKTSLDIFVNNTVAGFTTPLKNNDNIKLIWK